MTKNNFLILRWNSISKASIKGRPISSHPCSSLSTKAIHFKDAYKNHLNTTESSNWIPMNRSSLGYQSRPKLLSDYIETPYTLKGAGKKSALNDLGAATDSLNQTPDKSLPNSNISAKYFSINKQSHNKSNKMLNNYCDINIEIQDKKNKSRLNKNTNKYKLNNRDKIMSANITYDSSRNKLSGARCYTSQDKKKVHFRQKINSKFHQRANQLRESQSRERELSKHGTSLPDVDTHRMANDSHSYSKNSLKLKDQRENSSLA